MIDYNRIVSFGLLAHINDNSIGIRDFRDIFKPIVKSALAKMNYEGVKSGANIEEIKKEVDQLFSLDIPFPILREILITIAQEVSREEGVDFQIYDDNSFQMNKFVFANFDDVIESNTEEIDQVTKVYEEYLKADGIDPKTQPSLFDYIDQNRIQLSNFFAYRQNKEIEIEFVHQANFINSVKNIKKLFNILRKIYLGSIIAAYLEVEIGKVEKKIELVLDTNFILGLLDLDSIESHHTCKKIIEICDRLGYSKTVLPFTLEETRALIERKAQHLENSFFQGYLDSESIYAAAKRNNLSKTQLEQIANNFEKTLQEKFKIYLLPHDEKFRNIAKNNSPDIYDFYKNLRGANLGAWHDATASVYVRVKRGNKRIKGDFSKACCWFVTNTPYAVYYPDPKGYLPEIIRAGELINALWLSNPSVTSQITGGEIADLGLTRMVSNTISYSLPTTRVLRELDENFAKYGDGNKITADDTIVVANMILKKQVANPEYLNNSAKKDPNLFLNNVKELADRGREKERKIQESIDKILVQLDRIKEEPKVKIEKEIVTVDNPDDKKIIDRLQRQTLRLTIAIVAILFVVLSALLWTFEYIFNITDFQSHNNYWIVKIAGQLFLLFVSISIIKKKDRNFWIGTAITALFAILMYFKK